MDFLGKKIHRIILIFRNEDQYYAVDFLGKSGDTHVAQIMKQRELVAQDKVWIPIDGNLNLT